MDSNLHVMDAKESALAPTSQASQISAMETPSIPRATDAIAVMSRKFDLNHVENSIFQQAWSLDLSTIGLLSFEWSSSSILDILPCLNTELLNESNVKDMSLRASICAKDVTTFDFEGLWQEIEARVPAKLQIFIAKCADVTPDRLQHLCSSICEAFIGVTTHAPTNDELKVAGHDESLPTTQEDNQQAAHTAWCQGIIRILSMAMLEYDRVAKHHGLSQIELAQRCFMLLCRQLHLLETDQGVDGFSDFLEPEDVLAEHSMSDDNDVSEVSSQDNLHGVQKRTQALSPQANGSQPATNPERDVTIDRYEDIECQQQDLREDADDEMDEDLEQGDGMTRLMGSTLQAEVDEAIMEEVVSVKRKPGRPAKNAASKVHNSPSTTGAPSKTRNRNKPVLETAAAYRTRRSSLPDILGPNNAKNKITKRGPGRPRKTTTPKTAPALRTSSRLTRSVPPTAPVRRLLGRGRPIRVGGPHRSVTKASPTSGSAKIVVPETPSKRGPGRPRKHSPVNASPVVVIAPKRGPGRPRKHPIVESTSPVVVVTPERGPGRPRKYSVKEYAAPVFDATPRRSSDRLRKEVVVASPTPKPHGRGRPRKTI